MKMEVYGSEYLIFSEGLCRKRSFVKPDEGVPRELGFSLDPAELKTIDDQV